MHGCGRLQQHSVDVEAQLVLLHYSALDGLHSHQQLTVYSKISHSAVLQAATCTAADTEGAFRLQARSGEWQFSCSIVRHHVLLHAAYISDLTAHVPAPYPHKRVYN